jgi:hypothetical protein
LVRGPYCQGLPDTKTRQSSILPGYPLEAAVKHRRGLMAKPVIAKSYPVPGGGTPAAGRVVR